MTGSAPGDRPLNTAEVDQAAAALRDAGVTGDRAFGGFLAVRGLLVYLVEPAPDGTAVTKERLRAYLELTAENYRRVAAELGVSK